MWKSLLDLIDGLRVPALAHPARHAHDLQLATAVLLVEVMRAQDGISDAERRAAAVALRETFALDAAELDELLRLGEAAAREAHDFHAFTSQLNDQLAMEDRLRIVEWMWRVAYADGALAAHEQHVLWRVADLLHVPHGAYISAKMRARDAAAAAAGEKRDGKGLHDDGGQQPDAGSVHP